jgi:cbb3-type cytochrome oxidase subunit 3
MIEEVILGYAAAIYTIVLVLILVGYIARKIRPERFR